MADAEISLGLSAQELYSELQNVTAKFVQFSQRVETSGETAGKGFISKLKGAFGNVGNSIGGFFEGAAGQLAGLVSIGAVISEIQNSIHQGSEIHVTASKFGLDAVELQTIANAGKVAGLELDQVARGMALLAINAQSALAPTSKQAIAMEQLGINAESFAKLNPADQVLTLATAYKASAQDGAAFAAVSDLIGRKNTAMIPLLKEGGAGIEKLAKNFSTLTEEETASLHEIQVAEETWISKLHITVGKAVAGWGAIWHAIRGEGGVNIEDIFEKLAPEVKTPTLTKEQIKEEQADEKESTRDQVRTQDDADRDKEKLDKIEEEDRLASLPFEQRNKEQHEKAAALLDQSVNAQGLDDDERVQLKLQYHEIVKEIQRDEKDHAREMERDEKERQRDALAAWKEQERLNNRTPEEIQADNLKAAQAADLADRRAHGSYTGPGGGEHSGLVTTGVEGSGPIRGGSLIGERSTEDFHKDFGKRVDLGSKHLDINERLSARDKLKESAKQLGKDSTDKHTSVAEKSLTTLEKIEKNTQDLTANK